MVQTFYEVLGVPPSAESEDIEAAYREQLKNTHPDVSDEESGTDAVKAVIEAGDVLTDEAERERYDRLGHETYVAVTDAYDPTETTTQATTATESSTESASDSTVAEEPSPPSGKTAKQNPSASSGDVNTANANPEGVSWATGEVDDRVNEPPQSDRYVASTGERSILFIAALVAYPILIFASLYSGFLLPFRVIIAACAIVLVVYLVSVPAVSAPAFGILTIVAGAFVVLTNVPIPSIASVGVIIMTAVPFGLALFAQVVRL